MKQYRVTTTVTLVSDVKANNQKHAAEEVKEKLPGYMLEAYATKDYKVTIAAVREER